MVELGLLDEEFTREHNGESEGVGRANKGSQSCAAHLRCSVLLGLENKKHRNAKSYSYLRWPDSTLTKLPSDDNLASCIGLPAGKAHAGQAAGVSSPLDDSISQCKLINQHSG